MNSNKPLTREDVERLLQEAGSSTRLVLKGRNLGGIDLSGLDLSYANLYGANLSKANLSKANLSQADLRRASLGGASLVRTNLYGANLSGADLVEADLSQANLSQADLNGADLSQANLSQAKLHFADLSRANRGNFVTNLFRGRINRRSYLVGILASSSPSLVASLIFYYIHINTDLAAIVSVLVILLLSVVVPLFVISLVIRRFHDCNIGGLYVLWFFVPFIGVYFAFLLLFEKGTDGPNRYGPPPRPSIHLFSDPTR